MNYYKKTDKEKAAARARYHAAKHRPGEMERKAAAAKRWRDTHPLTHATWARHVLSRLKHKAKKDRVPFDLVADDLYVPVVCPVFGTELTFGGTYNPNSASVDRLKPALGYVRGNVAVISRRANMIKQDATAAEIRLVANWAAAAGA